jgi:hypothetical protein
MAVADSMRHGSRGPKSPRNLAPPAFRISASAREEVGRVRHYPPLGESFSNGDRVSLVKRRTQPIVEGR